MSTWPTDTELVLDLLTEESLSTRPPGIVLKHQIYGLLPDKTQVERELDALRKEGAVRVLPSKTEANDVAVLLSKEYDADVTTAVDQLPPDQAAVVRRFRDCLLDGCIDGTISMTALADAMQSGDAPVDIPVDEAQRALHSLGFITTPVKPNGRSSENYRLWSPRMIWMTDIVAGRKEILKQFQSKKHHEFSEMRLMGMKLKRSKLPMRYHIRDLIGLGVVRSLHTPAGTFYRRAPQR